MPLSAPVSSRPLPPYPEALAHEKKAAFVVCALMGVNHSAAWLRDPELTRLTGAALGRALDLLRDLQLVTERDPKQERSASR